ncbi:3-hydroxyacyl-CoA dehydrogenase type-2 [Melipona quadrifasciata]|uniref:3-hydroxyacyl-CoA dehydrogenase type-2 n=1 Tax=Melipona quadrifasciata TaxID=166423 RepID=A0A0M9A6U9_9HYME|nr:3-hydroxyacyl-CoA dehydrogenase type-2 [Melipona quadrifasciata]
MPKVLQVILSETIVIIVFNSVKSSGLGSHKHVALVTGGASGLGLGVVRRFVKEGAKVAVADLPTSKGNEIAKELGDSATFIPTDYIVNIINFLLSKYNCSMKISSMKLYSSINSNVIIVSDLNLILSLPLLSKNVPDEDGQRGVIINTASIAAFDGQMGQVAYSASKGAIVGMTLPLARDLAKVGIRVVTIAPGIFDTPMLGRLPEKVRAFLTKTVPFPNRLGNPDEYANLAQHIVENHLLNGEVIRLDGALRMQP